MFSDWSEVVDLFYRIVASAVWFVSRCLFVYVVLSIVMTYARTCLITGRKKKRKGGLYLFTLV